MDVTKEKFETIFNNYKSIIPSRIYEKFGNVDWRSDWYNKIKDSSVLDVNTYSSDTILNPKINNNSSKFYVIRNPNLESNLEDYTSDIINLEINRSTDNLRNKWILDSNL